MNDAALPPVTIIIPTRNRAADLRQCLESLLEQDYPRDHCETFVIDDGSTDGTKSHVAELVPAFAASGKALRFEANEGSGVNAAINTGLKLSVGQAIVTIGDDTLCPQSWLRTLVTGLVESGAEAVSGPLRIPTSGALVGKHREEVAACLTEVLGPVHWNGAVIPVAGNMAVWRRVYERGLFDETVKAPAEEIDWALRYNVHAAFVADAWAWHNKTGEALALKRVLKLAWTRGGEGGWWVRERLKMPSSERFPLAIRSLGTSGRALGHAVVQRCWGGVVVGLSELSRAMALVGLTHRGDRRAESGR